MTLKDTAAALLRDSKLFAREAVNLREMADAFLKRAEALQRLSDAALRRSAGLRKGKQKRHRPPRTAQR
jgi:hypothetical protein